MRTRITLLLGSVAVLVIACWLAHKPAGESPAPGEPGTNQSTITTATNESVVETRKLLVSDYYSTNDNDRITSLLTHQLIAERLRTNVAFFEWATNAAKSVIVSFMAKADIPVYGASGFTADALQFQKVTVEGMAGIYAVAIYDPDPTNEGPLEFIVEGGIHPTIQRVQNSYRTESYQLFPENWASAPRKIGRMDWSCAVNPLDTHQISGLARRAFHEMTGLDLDSFPIEKTMMDVDGVRNPNASHPEVTVTGNLNAKLYTPKDELYPFADFKYDGHIGNDSVLIAFSGEMVQTSPGRGEFVELFAVVRKMDAIFELGEKFLGEGNWEQAMLDNVRSLDDQQRGQIYRRVFQH